jgi:hypothetical protein
MFVREAISRNIEKRLHKHLKLVFSIGLVKQMDFLINIRYKTVKNLV